MSADSPIVVDELSSNPTDHFKVLETLNHGQKHFKCNYCNLQFKGTGTRCYVHLTGEGSGVSACTAVPENVITCIKAAKTKKQADSNRKRQASEAAAESKRQRRESVPGGSSSVPTGSGGGSVRSSQIGKAFARADKQAIDRALADFIFAEGLPLRTVQSPFLRQFIQAVQKAPAPYTPPAYNTLRTSLLDDAKKRVTESLRPWEQRLQETGGTLCSDGWSDAANRSLLNVLAVNPKGAKFLTAVNTTGTVKSAEFIAACLMEAIEELGPDNVVQVVTDNAQTCRAAGALIEAQYPHITWSPCVAHVCDLALEGIFALSFFKEVHSNTKGFVGFINNHHHTLAAWRQHQANAEGSVLQLIKPGETRFASALLMIERTIKVKAKLQQFVVSDNWNNAIATMKAADKDTANTYKDIILSAAHWTAAEQAFTVCEPILRLLRFADGDVPSSGKIHYYAYKVQQRLQEVQLDDEVMDEVQDIWTQRWEYMSSPLHGAAYCLDPEFLTDEGMDLGNNRDACVSDLLKMINKLVAVSDRQAVRLSYAAFRSKEGLFGEAEVNPADAAAMPAHQWWSIYGADHPQLQKLAITLLSQVSSACSCERNWSSYDFIHNRRRNRLTPARARDPVFVFTNGRLVRKMAVGEEGFIGWDEEEEMEGSGSEGEGEEGDKG